MRETREIRAWVTNGQVGSGLPDAVGRRVEIEAGGSRFVLRLGMRGELLLCTREGVLVVKPQAANMVCVEEAEF